MKLVSVDVWRFTGICVNGHNFVTHQFPDFQYGEGLIRTSDPRDLAFVQAVDDPIFEEIASIVKDLVTAAGKKNWYANCFDQVFGIACDPAPSGQRYSLTEKVHCSVCGSTELISYGPGEPPQVDTIELPHVTYAAWQQLSHDEKRERLQIALRERGCLD
jgi:hypothetical protein